MSPAAKQLNLLERAFNQGEGIVGNVHADQLDNRTPCSEWDVRQLLNHMTGAPHRFVAMLSGEPFEMPSGDLIGDDWASAYRQSADALLSAWRAPGALDRTYPFFGQDSPATMLLGLQITEVVLHSWDLARATDQEASLRDDELAQAALDFSREMMNQRRGHAFKEEVEVPKEAPLYDRVAAFSGRQA